MIEHVMHENTLLAMIVRQNTEVSGAKGVTSDEFSQQLLLIQHPKGVKITPHIHKKVERNITDTTEVLVIQYGKLRVDFYTSTQDYLHSRVLQSGDVIILLTGGHGFEVLEDIRMVEVKQGPYVGVQEKVRFEGIANSELNFQDIS